MSVLIKLKPVGLDYESDMIFFLDQKFSLVFLQIPMPLLCQALTERHSRSIKISHIFLFL